MVLSLGLSKKVHNHIAHWARPACIHCIVCCRMSVRGNNGDFDPSSIVELAIEKIISVMELSDILMTQATFGTRNKSRLLIRVAMVEYQI